MSQEPACTDCELPFAHHHTQFQNHFGEWIDAVVTHVEPRAETRDAETGEVIFPATKGPLRLIVGGASQ